MLHTLHDGTPRGTHTTSAQYKTAAATPPGEDSEARKKRLEAEAARRYRARQSVQRSLEMQVAAEQGSELDAALEHLAMAPSGARRCSPHPTAARCCSPRLAAARSRCRAGASSGGGASHIQEIYLEWRNATIDNLSIHQVYHIAERRGERQERLLTAVSLEKTLKTKVEAVL